MAKTFLTTALVAVATIALTDAGCSRSSIAPPAINMAVASGVFSPTPSTSPSLTPPQFPIDVGYNAVLASNAEQARIQSDYLDSLCSAISMSANLAAFRPNGTGCPRPVALSSAQGGGT